MVSREELYKLVWAEPMTKMCERFGVSRQLYGAREFLGSKSPLDAFCEWLTPEERYRSQYRDDVTWMVRNG